MKSENQMKYSHLTDDPVKIVNPTGNKNKDEKIEHDLENLRIRLKILREYLNGGSDSNLESKIINNVSDPLENINPDSKPKS